MHPLAWPMPLCSWRQGATTRQLKIMKTFNYTYKGFLAIALAATTMLMMGARSSFGDWHHDNDRNGYWDHHHHYHSYENYHHHRGYWDQRNGVRVFISI